LTSTSAVHVLLPRDANQPVGVDPLLAEHERDLDVRLEGPGRGAIALGEDAAELLDRAHDREQS